MLCIDTILKMKTSISIKGELIQDEASNSICTTYYVLADKFGGRMVLGVKLAEDLDAPYMVEGAVPKQLTTKLEKTPTCQSTISSNIFHEKHINYFIL